MIDIDDYFLLLILLFYCNPLVANRGPTELKKEKGILCIFPEREKVFFAQKALSSYPRLARIARQIRKTFVKNNLGVPIYISILKMAMIFLCI